MLHIATSDGATTVADGVTFTANKGAAQPAAGAFDQIDGLGFCNTLGNGLTTVDDISLVVPEPAAMALIGIGGAMMLLRRN